MMLSRMACAAILAWACAACAHAADATAIRIAIEAAIEQTDVLACPQARGVQEARGGLRGFCPRASDPHGLEESLRTLYARRGGSVLWSGRGGLTPQARALLASLRAADAYGLEPQDYRVDAPAGRRADEAEQARDARFDVALSAAALRFVSDLHFGRVDPRQAGFALDAPRRTVDLAAIVQGLATAQDVGRVLAAVQPQFLHYGLLLQALGRYRELAAQPDLTELPTLRRKLQPGDAYAGAPALRKLLIALGDLHATSTAGSVTAIPGATVMDASLVAALRQFQTRHGLAADGLLGKATYAALTTPMTQRVRQITLTLERWRWLPAFDTPPIIVNIPQFRLFAFESTEDRKASILQMDVIVGKSYPQLQTPVFAADMKYVIFRPYWDVPYSIMQHEMLAHIRADPTYLAQQHLEIVAGQTDAAQPLPPTPSNIDALVAGTLRIRQQPGPDNALGLIKFMLPNRYNVYLHSTPAHHLFKETRRTFSHGCIRVSDPVALAAYVLRNAPGNWSPEKIEAAMNGATTQRVNLARPIRVMILYGTVLATESGDVLFFDDVYGYDHKLEALLGLTPVAVPLPRASAPPPQAPARARGARSATALHTHLHARHRA